MMILTKLYLSYKLLVLNKWSYISAHEDKLKVASEHVLIIVVNE